MPSNSRWRRSPGTVLRYAYRVDIMFYLNRDGISVTCLTGQGFPGTRDISPDWIGWDVDANSWVEVEGYCPALIRKKVREADRA